MKKLVIAIIIIAAVGFLAFSSINKPKNKAATVANPNVKGASVEKSNTPKYQFPGILPAVRINNKKAVIKTAKGDIVIDLYADKAPKAVSNFVYLAEAKFYDGLTFHRVEPGFVVQGGDPAGNGTGGPGYSFADEPVVGDYVAGTVAMANSGPNTNGSQFFICLADQPTLPKNYSLFGQVTSGMDIVQSIAVGDKIESITIESK